MIWSLKSRLGISRWWFHLPPIFVNKLIGTQPHSLVYILSVSFELQRQSWVFVTETIWSTNSYLVNICKNSQKMFTNLQPRSCSIRAGGNVVQSSYTTFVETKGRRLTLSAIFYWGKCGWLTPPHPEYGILYLLLLHWLLSSITVSAAHDFQPLWNSSFLKGLLPCFSCFSAKLHLCIRGFLNFMICY